MWTVAILGGQRAPRAASGCAWKVQDKAVGSCGWSRRQTPSRSPPGPQVRAFLQHPLKGVVMETFGSGNGPTKPDLLQELRAATERGLLIVNCTHCLQGAVTSDYAAGMVGVGKPRPGEGASWAVTPAPHFPHMPPSPRPWREPA